LNISFAAFEWHWLTMIPHVTKRVLPGEAPVLRQLNNLFAEAFDDPATYDHTPSDAYLDRVLAKDDMIVLVALVNDEVVGGLVAYELAKLERERSEIYIYDLAVAEPHRRRGIATRLIGQLRDIARQRGAWVIYVQADYGDDPAIELYTKLGIREDVMHFDITP
jgi:aminoglycoside 3-N-acetyltransferase I